MSLAEGIHAGVAIEDYRALDALSSSRLGDGERSWAYCRYRIDHPDEATPAQARGLAVHALVWEPDSFARRFALKDFDARTNAGKARRDELAAAGVSVLDADTWDAAHHMANAVKAAPAAAALLQRVTQREVTVVWRDPTTGLLAKGRPDALASVKGRTVLIDLKTTRDAHPADFPKAIFAQGTHRQMDWYRTGLGVQGVKVDDVVLIAVLETAPYEVWVYRLKDPALEFGGLENERLARQYATCVQTGVWPAGPAKVIEVALPPWAEAQLRAEEFAQGESS